MPQHQREKRIVDYEIHKFFDDKSCKVWVGSDVWTCWKEQEEIEVKKLERKQKAGERERLNRHERGEYSDIEDEEEEEVSGSESDDGQKCWDTLEDEDIARAIAFALAGHGATWEIVPPTSTPTLGGTSGRPSHPSLPSFSHAADPAAQPSVLVPALVSPPPAPVPEVAPIGPTLGLQVATFPPQIVQSIATAYGLRPRTAIRPTERAQKIYRT
ncbi:hypothetical protein DFP72DRAFT_856685 [Ephemerocybe angulata]|uniref:Uncharacterized protein n=1 Tax=Ephemerocybe angulata TaxID=980116 RepID=A0A8H6HDT9_9AGAR|nr:hypothetical protein DFP72DRAFT_856685 [Tulosesus angulatus]